MLGAEMGRGAKALPGEMPGDAEMNRNARAPPEEMMGDDERKSIPKALPGEMMSVAEGMAEVGRRRHTRMAMEALLGGIGGACDMDEVPPPHSDIPGMGENGRLVDGMQGWCNGSWDRQSGAQPWAGIQDPSCRCARMDPPCTARRTALPCESSVNPRAPPVVLTREQMTRGSNPQIVLQPVASQRNC